MGLAIKPTAQTMFFSLSNCTLRAPPVATKLRFSIWSWTALHALDLYYKVAIFQPELGCTAAIVQLLLKTCTLRTRLVLQSCDFRAGAQNLYFACYTCTSKLRSSSQSWKPVLRVRDLYYKVEIFQLELETCTSCARLLLQGCDFQSWKSVLRALGFYYKVVIAGLRVPVLRVLDLYYKVAILLLELEACASRVRLVLQSYDFQAGAGNLYFAR